MNRKDFLKSTLPMLAMSGYLSSGIHKINTLHKISSSLKRSPKMPVLFLGHGSPMNAIAENEFVHGFREVARDIPTPEAILCISAHWETKGTFVTGMAHPKTIHDFGGFPQELFNVQYPAPGNPEFAKELKSHLSHIPVHLDDKWGLDHGAWSVIKHLYPKANIPVIQMSIDYSQNPAFHYELGRQLSSLRERGVLIIGSGNMVHNLRKVAWNKLDDVFGYDWALEASDKMKEGILSGNHVPLINYRSQGKSFDLAIPSPEHYLPLLYTLGLQNKDEEVTLFNDKPVAGALTMTSVKIG